MKPLQDQHEIHTCYVIGNLWIMSLSVGFDFDLGTVTGYPPGKKKNYVKRYHYCHVNRV